MHACPCKCDCERASICACVCASVCACVQVYMRERMHTTAHVCVHMRISVHASVRMLVPARMRAHASFACVIQASIPFATVLVFAILYRTCVCTHVRPCSPCAHTCMPACTHARKASTHTHVIIVDDVSYICVILAATVREVRPMHTLMHKCTHGRTHVHVRAFVARLALKCNWCKWFVQLRSA